MQLLDIKGLCQRLGGTRPVHRSTAYRLVQHGALPRPLKIGCSSRWRADEIDAVLQRLADARSNLEVQEKHHDDK